MCLFQVSGQYRTEAEMMLATKVNGGICLTDREDATAIAD